MNWERGYRCHLLYDRKKHRLGYVRLDTEGAYHWTRYNVCSGVASSLRVAKREVESRCRESL